MTARMSLSLLVLLAVGCGSKPVQQAGDGEAAQTSGGGGRESVIGYSFPVRAGRYTVLQIMTDGKQHDRAKANAEDTITNHPDIACMVGLWAYNPPAILSAVEAAGKLDQIRIVGFDENDETLQAIKEGKIQGTIVQQPFFFGYKSVEYMAALARGQQVDVPPGKMIYVPHSVITDANVDEFEVNVKSMMEGRGDPPKHDREDYDTSERVRVAFLTNSVDDFWTLAQRGCELAEKAFNADCEVYQPPNGSVEEQKRFMEDFVTQQGQGLAISPINAANQIEMINQVCEKMPVIAQDSDAPDTERKFYLGTSNYLAGRAAGELVKKACPAGGKVMIFVGKLEVLNAQERSKGVIDKLLDKPIPSEFAHQAS